MVSRANDNEAKELVKTLNTFLKKDLLLNLPNLRQRDAAEITFGALLGIMRSCNPLYKQPSAIKSLKVVCPLTRRFPTSFTGKLSHDTVIAAREIVDQNGPEMNTLKMWRLLLWIFFGDGGHDHQAWHLLKDTPVAKIYRAGDKRQPFEVLKWAIMQVSATGAHMRVFGSDGLDKKSRLSKNRILYLLEWHEAVPELVRAFHQHPAAFNKALCSVNGLRGNLTRKEVLITISASKHNEIRRVAKELIPFGPGGRNGAKVFLGIPRMDGKDSDRSYHDAVAEKLPRLKAVIRKYFPKLPTEAYQVAVADVERGLCGAVTYAKLVKKMRKRLPTGIDRKELHAVTVAAWIHKMRRQIGKLWSDCRTHLVSFRTHLMASL
eukprot:gnl/MRDRNA2_/MRDRNA2_77754_c0_seq2.p1 gnl/MRDRNA2_/MRDRNA2_77754_c0~~gnl/MRDRNA2_/MRDRNA2_77754_c0_seq2.p1  ORF type:complete len:377 (+),score=41.47 gnl/MRDRNA2_/MRDRNA2_77754_c0_seq2:63-1193(+)